MTMKDGLVFIGCCFPESYVNSLIKHNKLDQVAANVHGWNTIKGLKKYFSKIIVVNEHKLADYKKSKVFIHNSSEFIDDNVIFNSYSYINTRLLKAICKMYSISRSIAKIRPKNIIVYSLHTPYLLPAYMYKKKNPEVCLTAIVPDLPMLMGNRTKIIRKALKSFDNIIIKHMINRVDGFIILTESMREYGCIGEKPCLVEEGIIDISEFKKSNIDNTTDESLSRYIMYAGGVDRHTRLPEFIDDYLKADIDYELWIFGDGNFGEELKHISSQHDKIKYFGLVQRNELINYMLKASLLVNPRYKEDDYTKYSFPSKTMEYFLSEIPVMMERLPGIPDKYYDYILEVKDHNWTEALTKFSEVDSSEYTELGIKEREFIIKEKDVGVVGERMADFIKHLPNTV